MHLVLSDARHAGPQLPFAAKRCQPPSWPAKSNHKYNVVKLLYAGFETRFAPAPKMLASDSKKNTSRIQMMRNFDFLCVIDWPAGLETPHG